MLNVTPQQLRRAADIQERIQALQAELNGILQISEEAAPAVAQKSGRRKLSAQAIANIRAGVRKRMEARKATGSAHSGTAPRRRMSPAAKARLSALAKARWRQAKSQGRARL